MIGSIQVFFINNCISAYMLFLTLINILHLLIHFRFFCCLLLISLEYTFILLSMYFSTGLLIYAFIYFPAFIISLLCRYERSTFAIATFLHTRKLFRFAGSLIKVCRTGMDVFAFFSVLSLFLRLISSWYLTFIYSKTSTWFLVLYFFVVLDPLTQNLNLILLSSFHFDYLYTSTSFNSFWITLNHSKHPFVIRIFSALSYYKPQSIYSFLFIWHSLTLNAYFYSRYSLKDIHSCVLSFFLNFLPFSGKTRQE